MNSVVLIFSLPMATSTSSEEAQSYTSRATMSLEIKAEARRMSEVQTRVFTRWINGRLMKKQHSTSLGNRKDQDLAQIAPISSGRKAVLGSTLDKVVALGDI
ncbi:uncharacterized protein LOC134176606 [Corticium candelabrum]|uniref:uncharacterized protein LOC134176606 n=1 Tax=Corticium candelabrum TaxID=121492 RepID=UPI002E263102|nr:uncharacterized protein LOC134176606 [Corticium candelabrum]